LGYFEKDTVGLVDREDALNSAQQKFFKTQKEILQCKELDDRTYEKSLELSSRVLTEYILYREKIIQKMKSMSGTDSEAEIHNLIVPRGKTYHQDQIIDDIYRNNAWLLDDKFMTFRTILSESRMDKIINEILLDEEDIKEPGRPDIAMIFSADPDNQEPVDAVIVEIKKKTEDEKENQYAINQLINRAKKLTKHCPNIQRIWYYAVIQVNDEFADTLSAMNWTPLFSRGNVFYQEFLTKSPDGRRIPTPTFVMSFDAIVADAECRNHTFLEILRASMKAHAERNIDFTAERSA